MIQLTKDLWAKADDHCYIVGKLNTQRRKEAQEGRKARDLNNPTYYTTMAQAVQGALRRAMRQGVADGSITTLRQFIQEQERLQAELEALIALLDSGEARQNAVEAIPAAQTGNSIPEAQEAENAVQPVYIVEWCDHEGNRHKQAFDNQDSAQFKAQELEKEFCYVVILQENEV